MSKVVNGYSADGLEFSRETDSPNEYKGAIIDAWNTPHVVDVRRIVMGKHTPGPWIEWDAEIEGVDGSKIGQIYARPEDVGTWGSGVSEANSRLVVAAPELLAALEVLLPTLDACCEMAGFDKSKQHGRDAAIKAIAKAVYKGGE